VFFCSLPRYMHGIWLCGSRDMCFDQFFGALLSNADYNAVSRNGGFFYLRLMAASGCRNVDMPWHKGRASALSARSANANCPFPAHSFISVSAVHAAPTLGRHRDSLAFQYLKVVISELC